MAKRLVALLTLFLTLLCACAQAAEMPTYDGPAWTFEVPLSSLDDSLLTLASPLAPMEDSGEPKDLVTALSRRSGENGENLNGGVRKASNVSMQLREDAYDALVLMFNTAETEGVELYLRQGYRSHEDLTQRYENAVKRGDSDVPQPGQTDYQTGLAAMVVGKAWRAKPLKAETFTQTPECQWLAENCDRFGFILRYPEFKSELTGADFEPWHLRYVGTDIARYIHREGICLEEFLEVKTQAEADFAQQGGDLAAAIAAERLPEGPVLLDEVGPDGDRELTIFHD